MDADVAEIALDLVILDVAVAAMQLQGVIADLEARRRSRTAWPSRRPWSHRPSPLVERWRRRARPSAGPPRARSPCRRAGTAAPGTRPGGRPNWRRSSRCARARSIAGPGRPERAGGDVDAAAVEARHRDPEALALGAERAGPAGTRQSSKITIAVGCECQPSFFSCLPKLRPGVPRSTRRQLMPPGAGPAGAHHAGVEVAGAGARDEGLAAVEHVVVAVGARRGSRGSPHRSPRRARSGSSSRGAPWSSGRAASAPAARRCRRRRSSRRPCCGSRDRPRSRCSRSASSSKISAASRRESPAPPCVLAT